MASRTDGLKQFFPGAPREWVERLVTSDDETDVLSDTPAAFPAVLDDGGDPSIVFIDITKSGGSADPAAIRIEAGTSGGSSAILITEQNGDQGTNFSPGGIFFTNDPGNTSPQTYRIKCDNRPNDDPNGAGNHIEMNSGNATSGAAGGTKAGGNFTINAGSGPAGNGNVHIGKFNTSVVNLGAAGSVPVDIKGELTIGGIKFLVVTADPDTVVTAPKGSIASNTTNATLWQNTDGSTAWTAR